ncbi:hypothetical protein ENHYDAX1_220102 [Enhydrobacter sp. AX1]|nr:hypothetical protein ENHYDAX1_220102 [Enhydrobacter sp. AX1]
MSQKNLTHQNTYKMLKIVENAKDSWGRIQFSTSLQGLKHLQSMPNGSAAYKEV